MLYSPRKDVLTLLLSDTDKVSFDSYAGVCEDGYLVDMTDEEYGKCKKRLYMYFE